MASDRPVFTDEADAAFVGRLAALAGGPRVRVTAMRCLGCGADLLTEEYPKGHPSRVDANDDDVRHAIKDVGLDWCDGRPIFHVDPLDLPTMQRWLSDYVRARTYR